MMNVETTEEFDAWLQRLDNRSRIKIVARLAKLARGLWGDHKPAGPGVTELREHFGSGLRVYVTQIGETLIVVLGGGDKSTQAADIRRAGEMARRAKE